MSEPGLLRIGELSRRSGVSPELLRAWERRYGLLQPIRSGGGLRLYDAGDLERVRAMQRHLATGLAAAEAAALATRGAEASHPPYEREAARAELAAALAAFDEARAQDVLDALVAAATLDSVLSDVVVPFLHDLGHRWERGEASVAQEHFASGVLRARLLALARGWDRGLGPRVLLACTPGEQHDLGLIAFGLALRARGFRILYLGADTPVEDMARAAPGAEPELVVVSAVNGDRFRAVATELEELARARRVYVGGAGAAVVDLEVPRLTGGPVEEADRLTARLIAEAVP
ncbi:MAG: cobalamin B12-binding domain-containing protein [Actinomycetota bacterium]|nr:cobalamin B12-binding domain-containing protein [Actinomycetota bacterium]